MRRILKQNFNINIISRYENTSEFDYYTSNPHATDDALLIIKTHEMPSDDRFPAIYLARDGRDVYVSYAHYALTERYLNKPLSTQMFEKVKKEYREYQLETANAKRMPFADFRQAWCLKQFGKQHTQEDFDIMLREMISNDGFFGGWSNHVIAWRNRQAPTVTLNFEDFIQTERTVSLAQQALVQLGYTAEYKHHTTPSFSQLKEEKPHIYRRGKRGGYSDEMTHELEDLFWHYHREGMEELGYYNDKFITTRDQLDSLQVVVGELKRQIETSRQQLVEKETVIQGFYQRLQSNQSKMDRLRTYRLSSIHYWATRVWLKVRTSTFWKFIYKRRRRIYWYLTKSRLELYQYPPTKIKISNHYNQVKAAKAAPKISIVTPSYNQSPFLEKTIQSVLSQDYPELEYIIQDALSNDGTEEILTKYETQIAHIESVADRGQTHAINKGLSRATGEIMAYLNSDDLLLPGALHYIANYFVEHPDVDAVYGHRIIINEQGLEVGRWVLPPHKNTYLHWIDYVPQETLFWRRSLWEKVGGFDETFQFAMDWDYLVRMQEAGAKIVRLPRFIGAFRVHDKQKTAAMMDVGQLEMRRIRKNIHGYIPSYEELQENMREFYHEQAKTYWAYRFGLKRF